jgi:hypothetical protein
MTWKAFGGFGGHAIAVRGTDDVRHERSCFADEVVIDFPSIAPAVERMRSAFVADEHARTLTVALEITPRDASEGTTLPLDVPVRCTCGACGGRGETWGHPCSACAGTGIELLRHRVHITVPAGVEDGACFHFSVSARHDLSTRIELRVLVSPPSCD